MTAPRSRRRPLWLDAPTRFAGLSRRQAWWGLAIVALLLLACFSALESAAPPPATGQGNGAIGGRADVVLYQAIVDGVRHGGDYYQTTASQLRAGDYPLRQFVTFRLPTLAVTQAALPPVLVIALLYLLVGGTLLAWWTRLRPVLANRPAQIVALILLAAGTVMCVRPSLAAFHEVWAGPLIALSLALRRPGHWVEAVALGLIAMLIRETAVIYAAIMLAFAFFERERREALGWIAAIAVFALVVILHARAVAAVVGPLDPASPGWSGMLGFGFVVRLLAATTALSLFPLLLAAPLIGLALVGWAGWNDTTGLRGVAILVAYTALIGLAARPDTFYWAMMIAPLTLLGLAFAPDTIGDLVTRALDRRRITVTKAVR